MRDAMIRFVYKHTASSDYFRLDDILMTPDDAIAYLRAPVGMDRNEATEYLSAPPMECVSRTNE